MEEEKKRVSRWWRTTTVLTLGVVIGTVLMATPAASHIGSVTHLWNTHIKPKADARYVKLSTMAPGTTLRGVYNVECDGTVCEGGEMNFTLAAAPTAHYINTGDTPPAQCPGTVTNPKAAPGHLCVYEGKVGGSPSSRGIVNPVDDLQTATRFGAAVFVTGAIDTDKWIGGTWAVRAPLAGSARPVAQRTPGSPN
jgi:hypothetical protein